MMEFFEMLVELFTDPDFWVLVYANVISLGLFFTVWAVVSVIDKLIKKHKEKKNKENNIAKQSNGYTREHLIEVYTARMNLTNKEKEKTIYSQTISDLKNMIGG